MYLCNVCVHVYLVKRQGPRFRQSDAWRSAFETTASSYTLMVKPAGLVMYKLSPLSLEIYYTHVDFDIWAVCNVYGWQAIHNMRYDTCMFYKFILGKKWWGQGKCPNTGPNRFYWLHSVYLFFHWLRCQLAFLHWWLSFIFTLLNLQWYAHQENMSI